MNTQPSNHKSKAGLNAILTLPRFDLGTVVGTQGFVGLFDSPGLRQTTIDIVLTRYLGGDWGLMGAEDCAANEMALDPATQDRIVAKYSVPVGPGAEKAIYVITEADRSVTTLLLPSEY
ncbi:hypothetical protein [Pseudomonas asiatica]|uniref:hypothetical protein n=1 Tax=Pseudomonas asiatica TaxID=2219225 RepID=UPI0010C0BCFB|nr:hypothetical protein [Pseudomonas asiatica]EKT4529998.1 hypothetical protein [Pseudomonas putida]